MKKIPRALILEDDFIIVDNFDELFKKAIKKYALKWIIFII